MPAAVSIVKGIQSAQLRQLGMLVAFGMPVGFDCWYIIPLQVANASLDYTSALPDDAWAGGANACQC
jgi:hypothetical protein